MNVTFHDLIVGATYSRPELAERWGYSGFQALARGVVTPKGTPFIVLFVTAEKQSFQEQYRDELEGDTLKWEGPTDHFAEQRMLRAHENHEQIHLFYRKRHHSDFLYCGQIRFKSVQQLTSQPSRFIFSISEHHRLDLRLLD